MGFSQTLESAPRASRPGRLSRTGVAILDRIQGIDRSPDLREIELAVVGGADPHAGTLDDFPGDLLEARPPVDTAFQHDIALLHGIDAEAEQRVDIMRLHVARDEDDLHP